MSGFWCLGRWGLSDFGFRVLECHWTQGSNMIVVDSYATVRVRLRLKGLGLQRCTIGALINKTGFGGPLFYNYLRNPPK